MKDLFFFNSMLTPKFITFLYWLLLLVAVVSGIVCMFASYSGFTFGKFILGLVVIIAGCVAARIWCELLIVLFKIHDDLKTIALSSEQQKS